MTPEENNKLPSKQYLLVCKGAFDRNDKTHDEMNVKLDLILADIGTTKGQLRGFWWALGGVCGVVGFIGKFLWDHIISHG